MAVESVLIINNYGKPRLSTFYRPMSAARQQLLIRTIFRLVSNRPDGELCNFLDAPELTRLLPGVKKEKSKEGETLQEGRQGLRVIYRHYATLWFVFVVDQNESELGILDLIQVSPSSIFWHLGEHTLTGIITSLLINGRSLSNPWIASSPTSAN